MLNPNKINFTLTGKSQLEGYNKQIKLPMPSILPSSTVGGWTPDTSPTSVKCQKKYRIKGDMQIKTINLEEECSISSSVSKSSKSLVSERNIKEVPMEFEESI